MDKPEYLSSYLSSTAGLGVANDGSLDSCRIIQGMSGELKRGDKRYLPDARIGDFVLEGRDPPLIDGENGFSCLWIHTRPAIIESPPDQSFGALAQYREEPSDAAWLEETDKNGRTRKVFRRTSNRNILTRTMFGTFALVNEDSLIDFDALYTLRFTGKAIKNFYNSVHNPLGRRSYRIPNENGVLEAPPIFGAITEVKSGLDSNDYGDSWYVASVKIFAKHGDPGGPTRADLNVAEEIYHEREKYAALIYTPTPRVEPPEPPSETLRPALTSRQTAVASPPSYASRRDFTPTARLGSTDTAAQTPSSSPHSAPDVGYEGQQPFAPLSDDMADGPGPDDEILY
jgi:hypothetical protein